MNLGMSYENIGGEEGRNIDYYNNEQEQHVNANIKKCIEWENNKKMIQ